MLRNSWIHRQLGTWTYLGRNRPIDDWPKLLVGNQAKINGFELQKYNFENNENVPYKALEFILFQNVK